MYFYFYTSKYFLMHFCSSPKTPRPQSNLKNLAICVFHHVAVYKNSGNWNGTWISYSDFVLELMRFVLTAVIVWWQEAKNISVPEEHSLLLRRKKVALHLIHRHKMWPHRWRTASLLLSCVLRLIGAPAKLLAFSTYPLEKWFTRGRWWRKRRRRRRKREYTIK